MSSFGNNKPTDSDKKKAELMSALSSTGTTKTATPVTSTPSVALADSTSKEKGAVSDAPVKKQTVGSTGVYMPNATSASQSTASSTPKSTQVSYSDASGNTQTGYLLNGTTYADPGCTTPVAVGSTVTLPNGDKWYKGENGSYKVTGDSAMTTGTTNTGATITAPKSTQVTYADPNGGIKTGYLINGTTYVDPEGTTPIAVGSTVTLPSGDKWYKGATGSYQITNNSAGTNGYADLSPLINASHNIGDEAIREATNYNTQKSVDQLRRAMQDAQPTYASAIANQLLEAKQAQDAKALRNQVNGDRGGIGSAQIDSIGNTSAKNREAIAQQQRQLATDTARQIADLRAQGKYEESSQLLQNNQARLSALYEEQVRLQTAENNRKSSLASLGQSYLSAGIMPNADMLAAMGIDEATAKLYLDGIANPSTETDGNKKYYVVDDDDLEPDPKKEEDEVTEPLPPTEADVLALGFGQISAERLNELISMGLVEEYVENGRIRLRRSGGSSNRDNLGPTGSISTFN